MVHNQLKVLIHCWHLGLYALNQALPILKQVKVCGMKSGNYLSQIKIDIFYSVLAAVSSYKKEFSYTACYPCYKMQYLWWFPEYTIYGPWLCDSVKPGWLSNPSFGFFRAKNFSSLRDFNGFCPLNNLLQLYYTLLLDCLVCVAVTE